MVKYEGNYFSRVFKSKNEGHYLRLKSKDIFWGCGSKLQRVMKFKDVV